MRSFLILLLVFTLWAPGARSQERPKLVVGIVVDQMRYEYLERFEEHYSKGGFKRLIREGYSFQNNHYNYIPTVTAPGHTTIYTGTTPSDHGIVDNSWYERESKRVVSNVGDTTVRIVGSVLDNPNGLSPKRTFRRTITDDWRKASNYQGKVISVSLKDRGAIHPGGKDANAAYWYDWETSPGHFVSSSYYMQEVPDWVSKFNAEERADAYLSQTWKTLLPISRYDESAPDDNPYENLLRGKESPTFPYDFEAMRKLYLGKTSFYQVLWATPYANTLLKEFALEAMRAEALGTDEVTDFLCISFSTPDVAGHTYGPQSVELQDIYLRLDRDIAHILRVLDRKLGEENYLVFLTSDHGTQSNVAYAMKKGQAAGLVVLPKIKQDLSFKLSLEYGGFDWISHISDHVIYLDHDLIAEKGVSLPEMRQRVADFMKEQEGVRYAFTAEELEKNTYESGIPQMLQKGYHPFRSGDVLVAYDPGVVPTMDYRTPAGEVRGASHGSGYSDDTHVPLLWMGKGIPQGSSSRAVQPIDIAPTLARLLQFEMTETSPGKPLEELWEK